MNIFDGGNEMGYPEDSERRCKPDYESQIKKEQEQVAVSRKLLQVLYEYIDVFGSYRSRKEYQFTIASLIGALNLEIKSGEKIITNLIGLQEKEKNQ